MQYGASLGGDITGYLSHRRPRGIVAEHLERYRDGDPEFAYAEPLEPRTRPGPPVVPLLAALCAAEAVVVGAGLLALAAG